MESGYVVPPIVDISPKGIYQIFLQQKRIAPTPEINKQVLRNRYWLGKGLYIGLSMHFRNNDQGITIQNFKLYNLYKRET